ncbi:pilus assembly FimT family protein [Pseudohongiella sp.]|uniref:General secretion pathway GspH domain-containing protein n=1 Tax=marine sediment metagenome TaxID=412755 RepID=A0A0F9W765_9ZZZZ|nr:type II secretion system protein [Pseudohongiella sp.]HDZ09345.1 type II secretion system protein [Pseudohongiella sp.]HEA63806.1 type II secretion system protein [Pseudohongiella sp.]
MALSNASPRSHSVGFSIIELVIVVLLIGIVSAVAMARILRSDTYNPIIARDQLVSIARSAQQKAIGRTDVSLQIQPIGNNLQFRIEDDTGVVESIDVDLAEVIPSGDTNQLASCSVVGGASVISLSTPMVIYYNKLGDLLEGGVVGSPGYPQEVTSGARVCINNDPVMSVCLSAAGYAYVGDCIE